MNAIRMLAAGGVACAAMVALLACETGDNRPVNRERVGRALESPVARNSASGEIANLTAISGVPLVDVGLPNSRDDKVQVRTIADNIFQPAPVGPTKTITTTTRPVGVLMGTPTTRPKPAETQPGVLIDPLLGPRD